MDTKIVRQIENLAESRGRFRPEAYFWVLRALEFTRRHFRREKHVSGKELLEGTRLLALDEYGPMAYSVFEHWGLGSSEDFGRIVFDLVEEGLLSREDQDTPADFVGGYDFERTFLQDYPW